MLKAKEFKVEDSNIANLGGAMDKAQRECAAQSESAWDGVGKAVGTDVWRIEKFQVVPWPKEEYGTLYAGDAYIVLRTYKPKADEDKLAWDVHFWLGSDCTQDEAGTAAYKTVELDDLLGGAPVQYREVQDHESTKFLNLFRPSVRILEGGVDSGFKVVKPDEYKPRLLWIKGKNARRITVRQVPLENASLNQGDCFMLDKGLTLYQWNGESAGPFEKNRAAEIARAIDDQRGSKVEITVLDGSEENEEFHGELGGSRVDVLSAEAGGSDADAEQAGAKKLFQLSDASGTLTFSEVGSGELKRSQLDANDVFVLDSGAEIFVWVGKGASDQERKMAMARAQEYLIQNNRPAYLPIIRVLDGGENETFEAQFT